MNRLGLVLEKKLDIIHETKQATGEFKVQVSLLFFDELDAGQVENEAFQRRLRVGGVLLILDRRNRMLPVMSQGRNAIRARGTRIKAFHARELVECAALIRA